MVKVILSKGSISIGRFGFQQYFCMNVFTVDRIRRQSIIILSVLLIGFVGQCRLDTLIFTAARIHNGLDS